MLSGLLPRNACSLQSISDVYVIWPDIVLPLASTDHTGHDAARMHADPHIDIQVVSLRANFPNITNHTQA